MQENKVMRLAQHILNAIFQPEKQLIFPSKLHMGALALILTVPSAILPFWFFPWPLALALVLCFVCLGSLVVFVEVWFRHAHKKVYGRHYQFVKPEQTDDLTFMYEPHPFVSYIRKPGLGSPGLNLETNRFRATYPCGRAHELKLPKPEGVYRISCLGASETSFYEKGPNGWESYPSLLERKLQEMLPGMRVEVNNFAAPGYTTAEILIEFILNSIETQPDTVIIYQGYNDIRAFLTPGFSPDYFHIRRNFAQEHERMRISGLLPLFPLHFYNFLLWQSVCVPPPTRIVGDDVHYAVTRGRMDIAREPEGLDTYRRNLNYIIQTCKAHGIQVLLSTFCFFFDEDNRADAERLKWENKVHEVIALENTVVKDLAQQHGLPLVDNYNLIPQDRKYFKDKIHFTLEGMNRMAANLAKGVVGLARRRPGGEA